MIEDRKQKDSLKVSFETDKKWAFRSWILSSLLSLTRTHLLNMINLHIDEDSLIVDMGCNIGYITRTIALRTNAIGLDIDKHELRWAKKCNKRIDFVCCDLCYLPLRNDSVNIAVCGSVFEHIENLSQALKEIHLVLKRNGKLAAGYPIETRLLELVIKLFLRSESHVWSQHEVTKNKEHITNPHIHRQNFLDIRKMLRTHFSLLKRRKIPQNFFPDLLSIYENVLLIKN